MTREFIKEIVNTNTNKPMGRVWWNSEKGRVEASNRTVMNFVKTSTSSVGGDGKLGANHIKNLGSSVKSGYVTVKDIDDE